MDGCPSQEDLKETTPIGPQKKKKQVKVMVLIPPELLKWQPDSGHSNHRSHQSARFRVRLLAIRVSTTRAGERAEDEDEDDEDEAEDDGGCGTGGRTPLSTSPQRLSSVRKHHRGNYQDITIAR